MMKKASVSFVIGLCLLMLPVAAAAHFGMIIPSDTMVFQKENRKITITLSFSHPFEVEGMEMEKPAVFGVMKDGRKTDLLQTLDKTKFMGHTAWKTIYHVKRPGVYLFYMEPKPYWESAEDAFIIHYTKTVVAAFGDEEGWDRPLGLKTEIIPLTRPFGLYAGNVFQGIVLLDGNPVPHAEIEVEYYNKDKRAKAANDYMITQVIKADGNGVFTYAAPKAGWWGFAALTASREKLNYKGEEKDVELGAVIWVRFLKFQ